MNQVWGVKVRSRVVERTTFVCPRCGVDRDGSELVRQRWFTVLYVPLVPLAMLEPVIECGACGHQCDLGVLDIPTSDQLSRYLEDAMRRAVATVVRAAGADDVATRTAAVAAMRSAGHDYDDVTLNDDVRMLAGDGAALSLRRLVDELTPHGKQSFLHRMAAVAQADGSLSADERRALVEIGVALGMPAPHINGVLAVATLELEAA